MASSALSCRRCMRAVQPRPQRGPGLGASHSDSYSHSARTPLLTRSTQNGASEAGPDAVGAVGRKELADAVSVSLGLSKRQSEEAINVLLNTIVAKVAAGHKVSLPGFGVWEAKKRASRNGRNPLTGEALVIPEKTVPRFSAGTKFKEAVDPAVKQAKDAAKAAKDAAKPALK